MESLRRRLTALSRLWVPFSESGASVYAAGSSFYILLSVFPAALFLLSLLPYLPISLEAWLEVLQELVPEPFFPLVTYTFDTVRSSSTLTLLSISAVTTLWSASRGVGAIVEGLDAVLGRARQRRYLQRRIMSILYFLLLALALSAMLTVHVFGEKVLAACVHYFPRAIALVSALYRLRFIYVLLVFGVTFALVYWLFPRRSFSFRSCALGGLVAAVGWILISQLFSIYVNYFAGYVKLYDGIGLLLLTCLWLNLCLLFFLYGAVLTSLLHRSAYHPLQILREALGRR